MKGFKVAGLALITLTVILMLLTGGCFGNANAANGNSGSTTPAIIKPQPRIENVVSTTTGNQSAYFGTLDIKVKNDGAEGTVLVQATMTQAGKTSKNEMPVFLKKGESHELKLTFPLVWGGGDPTYEVKAILP